MFRDPTVVRIAGFLRDIGIPLDGRDLSGGTVLPGVLLENGALTIDEARLAYPGDVLHEAGHLAVMTPAQRATTHADTGDDGGLEMAAIAWSYAAAIHIRLALEILFHEGGYRGASSSIIENFAAGHYFGVPVLEWLGMTAGPERARELGVQPYPHMLQWLRA